MLHKPVSSLESFCPSTFKTISKGVECTLHNLFRLSRLFVRVTITTTLQIQEYNCINCAELIKERLQHYPSDQPYRLFHSIMAQFSRTTMVQPMKGKVSRHVPKVVFFLLKLVVIAFAVLAILSPVRLDDLQMQIT